MLIREWASEFKIPFTAVLELERRMGLHGTAIAEQLANVAASVSEEGAEARQQQLVRFDAAKNGCKLFRNNVGVLQNADGVPVRYGLCNDTPALNKQLKSSDLIGWRRMLITPEMVGLHLARTILRECKPSGWTYSGTPREAAQLRFLEMGAADGADAAFVTGAGSF